MEISITGKKMPYEVLDLLADPTTVKMLATVDGAGAPNSVIMSSLTAMDEERVMFVLFKRSKTYANLMKMKKFAATILKPDQKEGYQIKGTMEEFHDNDHLFNQIKGEVFQRSGMTIIGVIIGGVEEVYTISMDDPGRRLV